MLNNPADWTLTEDGRWLHRPRFKVAINRVLRALQPWPRKWVIYTTADHSTSPPTVTGYGIGRVLHT